MVVEVPVSTPSLADAMGDMRKWLDHRRCTPILFATTRDGPGTVLIRVEFADPDVALAFRAAFGASEPEAPAAAA